MSADGVNGKRTFSVCRMGLKRPPRLVPGFLRTLSPRGSGNAFPLGHGGTGEGLPLSHNGDDHQDHCYGYRYRSLVGRRLEGFQRYSKDFFHPSIREEVVLRRVRVNPETRESQNLPDGTSITTVLYCGERGEY